MFRPLNIGCAFSVSLITVNKENLIVNEDLNVEYQAQAGMAFRDIAASAYRAYAASTGNKNFRGEPMPQWESLPRQIQIAWEAAARQVERCFYAPDYAVANEQVWATWLPPGEESPA